MIAEMTRRLVAEFGPCQIYLFGSHAWGKPNADSDVDLFVILPKSDQTRMGRDLRALHCLSDLRVAKDVLVQTQAEVDRVRHVYASLECEILERGVILHG